jgi:membrane complex biogenesis BtpA family protein
MNFKSLFKTKNPIIGMVHFPPLLGYKDFPGLKICLRKSLRDAKTLEKGGVDAIMFENNYDIPHREFVSPETVAIMTFLIQKISEKIKIPFGVNVLWNDYKAALSIAKVCGGKFVRIPVFVDSVETSYGKIFANPKEVLAFRKKIDAENVALFTDIHVKHAKMLEQKSISESAKEAVKNGSDAIIITGKWTGDAPNIFDLKEAREAVGKDFPILIGSGATKDNVGILLKYADGVIVGTALKTGQIEKKEVNLKPWETQISLSKTKEFVKKVKKEIVRQRRKNTVK